MRTGNLVLLTLLAATLAGCAGMSEQACLSTDWQTVGFEDGVAGRSPATISRYRQSCADYGIAPDLAEYRAGHDAGVRTYCRAGNGFEVGRSGVRYAGVCPADLESEFLAAYNEGRQLYELEAALLAVDSQIAARMHRSEELAAELVTATSTIVASETTPERRAELMLRVAAIGQEQGRIGKEIEALQVERIQREADLDDYRRQVSFASL
jgi:hypothetical protein